MLPKWNELEIEKERQFFDAYPDSDSYLESGIFTTEPTKEMIDCSKEWYDRLHMSFIINSKALKSGKKTREKSIRKIRKFTDGDRFRRNK